jgi:hypothetical protein
VRSARPALTFVTLGVLLSGCAELENQSVPFCPGSGPGRNAAVVLLMAQAVPSAAYVPCISEFPAGWSFGGERIRKDRPEFWLNSDRAGSRALTVTLTRDCDTSKAVEVPPESGEPLMKRYEEPNALPPAFSGNRYYVFPGGCVTYRFAFLPGATFAQAVETTEALTFVARALGVTELAKDGLILCGRGVRCPG